MIQNLSDKDLKLVDFDNTLTFQYEYTTFNKDTKFRDIFNKMMSADIKHAFTKGIGKGDKQAGRLDVGCSEIILVNSKGQIVHLYNSEWGAFSLV